VYNTLHMEDVLTITDLSHNFAGLTVVDDVSLTVKRGEFVSLVGPSGCGKSTLLKIAAGLIQPAQGSAYAVGQKHVVFQDPVLLPWRTARENLLLPALLQGHGEQKAAAEIDSLFELVGLSGFENAYPWQLSGGMQQRVALARGLLGKPDLLFMDEPFGALDEMNREKMNTLLLRTRERFGGGHPAAVLFVTHSIPEAVYLSDRIIVLSERPAKILSNIEVPIPRPRRSDAFYTDEFNQLVKQVRLSLRQ
jgi:NitT/TauT family transport system ATP-binding protein